MISLYCKNNQSHSVALWENKGDQRHVVHCNWRVWNTTFSQNKVQGVRIETIRYYVIALSSIGK